MSRTSNDMKLGLIASAVLVALGGCDRDVSSAEAPPSAVVVPVAKSQPATVVAATASAEPALSSMHVAESPQKLGVPVDLRYEFEGDVQAGRSVTLHLAAVPRVAGSNLLVSVKKEAGVSITAADFMAQKASVSTAYRQQISVTKLAGGPSELHVLVTMEVPEGSAHGWFNIPLEHTSEVSGKGAGRLK